MTSISMRDRMRVPFPPWRWVRSDPHRLLVFGFGSGLLRPGSGTWGTLVAWALWLMFAQYAESTALGAFLLLAFVYGCWACGRVARELQVDDHVGMVWDEIVAFWLVLWLSPPLPGAQIVAFVLFRLFDSLKPPPIRYFDERFKGGFGVMWDDLLAAVYTLVLITLASRAGWFDGWITL
jgi:phosphatidylglycerophosphatase A